MTKMTDNDDKTMAMQPPPAPNRGNDIANDTPAVVFGTGTKEK